MSNVNQSKMKKEQVMNEEQVVALEDIKFPKATKPSEEILEKVLGQDLVKRKDVSSSKHLDPRDIVEEENFNVRVDYDLEEIKNSIKENGVMNPMHVFYDKDVNKYVLIDGHRRYRAVMELINEGVPIKTVPVVNMKSKPTDEERTLSIAVLNQGKSLSILEKGIVYRRLSTWGWSQAEIAKKVGTTQANISQCIKAASYPKQVQNLISSNEISVHEVNKIASTDDAKKSDKALIEHVTEAVNNAKEESKENGKKVKAKATHNKAVKEIVEKKATQNVSDKTDNELTFENIYDRFKQMAKEDNYNIYLDFAIQALDAIKDGKSNKEITKLSKDFSMKELTSVTFDSEDFEDEFGIDEM